MRTARARRRRQLVALEAMEPRIVLSVTIEVRYDYDTAGFFASSERRAAMAAAAARVGAMLQDNLAAITPGGANTWAALFDHPVTGQRVKLNDLVVPADTLIVFAAGADLPGSQTGEGGPGGWSASGPNASWFNLIEGRGQPGALANPATDVAPWGGMIRFDTTGTNWFFGVESTSGLTSNKTDFLSVATHELGHLLGIGTSESWSRQINTSNGTFNGSASRAENGGNPVPLADGSHWAGSVRSDGDLPSMAAVLMNGSRTLFTALDRAALTDIGWEVQPGGSGGTPTVSLDSAEIRVSEAAGTINVPVTRSSGTGAATVRYTLQGLGASLGADVLGASSGVLNFGAGQTTAQVTLTIVDDQLREGSEAFRVILSSPTGATLGETTTTTVTIADNEHRGQGDLDGDGKADLAVFQPSNALWLSQLSAGGTLKRAFGSPRWAMLPVPADYDGDGKMDLAMFRPSDGRWMVSLSGGGSINKVFGRRNLADLPVPADYDGDGKADLAVFRVAEGRWLAALSGGGSLNVRNATNTLSQIPVPADYDGDGKADLALFQPADGRWIIPYSGGGSRTVTFGAPRWQHVPIPADYDGDGKADLAVFAPADARWLVALSGGGTINRAFGGKSLFHVPIHAPIAAMRKLGLLR